MSRVRIVGGGLTGILAAMQAHRLGFRNIELHERFDELGGVARASMADGLEVREGCIYFGPLGDPMRDLLEAHGLVFEEFENSFGSVSCDPGGEKRLTHDFGGPALLSSNLSLSLPAGDSLEDRIAAYPIEIAEGLRRYCHWHLGADLAAVHESAAIPLGINRVFPVGPNVEAVIEAKRVSPLHDELFGAPRGLWGRRTNATAALPVGGFSAFFEQCRAVLEGIGVRVHDGSLIAPKRALAEHAADDVLVWAANPMPLFKAAGLVSPGLIKKSFATYAFEAAYDGPAPFYVQNFTGVGAVFRLYIYPSGGRLVVLAECVREVEPELLKAEMLSLMQGFDGELSIGPMLDARLAPRWIYQSVEAMDGLKQLRRVLRDRMGASFAPGAWEPYSKAEKFAEIEATLTAARDDRRAVSEAA